MQGYNCIMIYNLNKSKILFLKRLKDPYKGLYNLIGGKIEENENGFHAAYRELYEETGITTDDVELFHMMDFKYYNQNCYVEVYAGVLKHEVNLQQEIHPLFWMSTEENFFDINRFAGEGNIGHMVEQVNIYGMGIDNPSRRFYNKVAIDNDSICIGIDGCKGGWIYAALVKVQVVFGKVNNLQEILCKYPEFDECLIDMVIGLPSNKKHIRPDTYARKIIRERASTIFPAPCRQAVYAGSKAEAYKVNEHVLGKKFTPLTYGIMSKMYELDTFLKENYEFKNRIKESHPEVCFARLNGSTVMSKKSESDGIRERVDILNRFLPRITTKGIMSHWKILKCTADDILDALCLAVTGDLVVQGMYEVIPDTPMMDEEGLLMQMVIPKGECFY